MEEQSPPVPPPHCVPLSLHQSLSFKRHSFTHCNSVVTDPTGRPRPSCFAHGCPPISRGAHVSPTRRRASCSPKTAQIGCTGRRGSWCMFVRLRWRSLWRASLQEVLQFQAAQRISSWLRNSRICRYAGPLIVISTLRSIISLLILTHPHPS